MKTPKSKLTPARASGPISNPRGIRSVHVMIADDTGIHVHEFYANQLQVVDVSDRTEHGTSHTAITTDIHITGIIIPGVNDVGEARHPEVEAEAAVLAGRAAMGPNPDTDPRLRAVG